MLAAVDDGLHPDPSTQSITSPQDGAVRSDVNTHTWTIKGPTVQLMLQPSPTEKLNVACADTGGDKNQA